MIPVCHIRNIEVLINHFLTDPNSRGEQNAIYFATFKLGSSTFYVENVGAKAERKTVKNYLAITVQKLITNGELDISQFKHMKQIKTNKIIVIINKKTGAI